MDRRSARDRLARSRAPYLLERALNMVSKPLVVFDEEGREVLRNRALKRLVGSDGDEEGLVERMREAARRTTHQSAPAVVRTPRGGYALRGRRLDAGGMLEGSAILVALEPV